MNRIMDTHTDHPLPKASRAYSILRADIISMRLAPGQVLNEHDICAQLGVSRTPFREAVLRLASENMVRVVPSDATYVSHITIQDVLDGQLIRQTLELRMIGLAARNYGIENDHGFELILLQQRDAVARSDYDGFLQWDNAFHQNICRTAGFSRVWDAIRSATGQVDRVRRHSLAKPDQIEEAYAEHQLIWAALRNRDASSAKSLMERHIEDILRATKTIIDEVPDCVVDPDVIDRLQALFDVK